MNPRAGTPMALLIVVVVVPGQLLLDLFLLLGLKVVVRVQEVAGRQDAGTDQDQGEFASHSGHDWAPRPLVRVRTMDDIISTSIFVLSPEESAEIDPVRVPRVRPQ